MSSVLTNDYLILSIVGTPLNTSVDTDIAALEREIIRYVVSE